MADTLTRQLDVSKTVPCLLRCLPSLGCVSGHPDVLKSLLNFCGVFIHKAREVASLVARVNALDECHRATFVRISVANWIHATHRLEGESLPDSSDTERLVESLFDSPNEGLTHVDHSRSDSLALVLNTFRVLKDSYCQMTGQARMHVVDKKWIIKQHQKIFSGIPSDLSSFRRCLAHTTNLDGSVHIYPRHTLCEKALDTLCGTVHKLAEFVDRNLCHDQPNLILHVFALAAFVQFHFVDIHPFGNGNGRMCRLLSKHMLDAVLPAPFSMFPDRQKYLNALIRGRMVSPREEPQLLLELLLDECISHYSKWLDALEGTPVLAMIWAHSEKDCESQLNDWNISDVDVTDILAKYRASEDPSFTHTLSIPPTVTRSFGDARVTVFRVVDIDAL